MQVPAGILLEAIRMRIGLGQLNCVVGDLRGNAEKMRQTYARAKQEGVELLLFPELAVCGYPPEDLLLKPYFLQDNMEMVEQLAADCPEITVVVGFAEDSGDGACNSAAVLRGGRVEGIYRKFMLPNYGVFDEYRYFRPGTQPLTIQVGELAAAVTICEDIWEIDRLCGFLRGSGAFQLLLNISASPYCAGKTEQRKTIIGRCARRLNAVVAYCNLVGGQDELVFDGRSMFVDQAGNCIATAAAFEEDLLIGEVEAAGKSDVKVVAVGPVVAQPASEVEEIYLAVVRGTKDYVLKNGFSEVLLGLSGGIDSSVTAAIAVAALGAESVTGVTMPSRFNSPQTVADAERLARNLGIRLLNIPIEGVLAEFDRALAGVAGWDNKGVAYENLQARVRGCILMSLSNQFGSLVLTTGNKSENAVGYSTLYGDTAGGFAVLKDVPKTLVYRLAEYINTKAGREMIPAEVISRAPTAELRPGQKDTDALPPYELLDRILQGYVEEDMSAADLVESGLPAEVVEKVILMVDRSEYKRRQSPPGVKITPRAFGKDRRLPITNRYDHRAQR